jgi:hypothetical protein
VKKLTFVLPFLLALFLVQGYAAATARAETPLAEPTTCAHNANQIAGRMTLDADHDALPDTNEGVPGITVILANVQSSTTVLQTVTTDQEGCYRFNRALVTNGQLHRISWSGMHPSNNLIHDPDNGTVPGTPNFRFIGGQGQPAETDVVYRSSTIAPYITQCPFTDGSTSDIGGMVALDANGNNQADPGEGIRFAVVTLAVVTPDQIVGQVVTDANGCYRIPRVTPANTDITGCCNHLTDGSGGDDITGCCNHLTDGSGGDDISGNYRTPHTTYMYVSVSMPEQYGSVAESYDPNGRQTPGTFYEVFTTPNGSFETDFLWRDFTPTAVAVSAFGVAPTTPAWLTFVIAGSTLVGAVIILFRRRTPLT